LLAADWKYLSSSNGAALYVDVESLKELPPISVYRPFYARQLWVKAERENDTERRRTLSLFRVDCDGETIFQASGVTYGSDGKTKDSWNDEEFAHSYEPAIPGSLGYAVMEFACGRRAIDAPYR
jgi:hypothetical protein